MPHDSLLLRSLLLAVAALGAAACGTDSGTGTGPTGGETASQAALAIDSVYVARLAAGTAADSQVATLIADYLEVPAAFGAAPKSFTITTASGTETWQGFGAQTTMGAGTSDPKDGDSTFYVLAYPDRSLTTFLIAAVAYDSTGVASTEAILVYDTDSVVYGTPVTVSGALHSTGAACGEQSGLDADSAYTLLTTYSCFSTTIIASASASFAGNGLDASLASLAFTSVTFNSAYFYYGTGADRRPRLSARP